MNQHFENVLNRVDAVILEAEVGLVDAVWKQKDDRSKDIANILDKQRSEYLELERVHGEAFGD